jgi:hypothetical protein
MQYLLITEFDPIEEYGVDSFYDWDTPFQGGEICH